MNEYDIIKLKHIQLIHLSLLHLGRLEFENHTKCIGFETNVHLRLYELLNKECRNSKDHQTIHMILFVFVGMASCNDFSKSKLLNDDIIRIITNNILPIISIKTNIYFSINKLVILENIINLLSNLMETKSYILNDEEINCMLCLLCTCFKNITHVILNQTAEQKKNFNFIQSKMESAYYFFKCIFLITSNHSYIIDNLINTLQKFDLLELFIMNITFGIKYHYQKNREIRHFTIQSICNILNKLYTTNNTLIKKNAKLLIKHNLIQQLCELYDSDPTETEIIDIIDCISSIALFQSVKLVNNNQILNIICDCLLHLSKNVVTKIIKCIQNIANNHNSSALFTYSNGKIMHTACIFLSTTSFDLIDEIINCLQYIFIKPVIDDIYSINDISIKIRKNNFIPNLIKMKLIITANNNSLKVNNKLLNKLSHKDSLNVIQNVVFLYTKCEYFKKSYSLVSIRKYNCNRSPWKFKTVEIVCYIFYILILLIMILFLFFFV